MQAIHLEHEGRSVEGNAAVLPADRKPIGTYIR